MERRNKLMVVCVVMAMVAMTSMGTMQDDEKDCADQLTNLASCIPFVSGSAKKPTQQCCDDTKKVKAEKPKCLCVLIKESTDPSMGLPINTTLAMQMPAACNIDAKPSDCPSILKLPADSPDAKIFKDADAAGTTTTPSPPDSVSAGSASGTKVSPTSNVDGAKLKGSLLFGLLMISVGFIFT